MCTFLFRNNIVIRRLSNTHSPNKLTGLQSAPIPHVSSPDNVQLTNCVRGFGVIPSRGWGFYGLWLQAEQVLSRVSGVEDIDITCAIFNITIVVWNSDQKEC